MEEVRVGEQRWLSEREACAWRGCLAMWHALERAVDRQLTRESGLSAADYQLLVPLSEAPGTELRARDLGRDVDWERSRISHQIRRMEQRGLISRRDCPTDARGTVIALTEAGSAAIRDAAPSHVDWVRENFIDVLTPDELDSLRGISERVLSKLASEGCQGETDSCGSACSGS
ncbi:MAG: MarR family winged helix-turn-helix transcriptional regulator [Acidimicrobiales bacterium]|jgi:DNA-binding MarR family transcriptional regulator